MDTNSSSTAITAAPAGMAMVGWYESRSVSRATAFRLATMAGLELGRIAALGRPPSHQLTRLPLYGRGPGRGPITPSNII